MQDSINEIAAIILSNHPFYMNNLEDLQSNWNILEARINEIMNAEVFYNCILLMPLYDIFIYSLPESIMQSDLADNTISSYISSNYESILEKFKINLKTLFAKTNKALLKIIQNYPEKNRNDIFYMFTEKTANKILKCQSLEELNDSMNKNFDILYLMMTSARANIWKDNKVNLPSTYINYNNIELAIVILMNSIFSYYGEYNKDGGKCFNIKFLNEYALRIWDGVSISISNEASSSDNTSVSNESSNNTYNDSSSNESRNSSNDAASRKTSANNSIETDIKFSLEISTSTTTFKNASMSLTKYSNNTLFISDLLLNSQNPFDVDYELIPNISADMYSLYDVMSIASEYKKQVNKSWNNFSDILIGFDDKDTYKNQTFKRLVYNIVLQKVCNWTLFIPLNTFFDCSNINRIHEENGIKIKPSDLAKGNLKSNNVNKLELEDLTEDIEAIHKRATESRQLGKVLKINCMTMSNPPTETEINRYKEIKSLL